jgi:hypothetical protein
MTAFLNTRSRRKVWSDDRSYVRDNQMLYAPRNQRGVLYPYFFKRLMENIRFIDEVNEV